jgi:type IV fimbrial biogenesis protein FimT
MRGIFKNRGFTLIELMITLVVLVVLISLAAPAMTSLLETRRMAGASQAVYEQLQYARTEAIKQSRNMFVVIDEGDAGLPWCVGVGDSPDCVCQEPGNDEEPCTVIVAVNAAGTAQRAERQINGDAFPNITLTTTQSRVGFDPIRGTVFENAGTEITLTSAPRGLTRTWSVNVVGRITAD